MRAKAKDPALIRLIGEFLKVYLPSIKNRDQDTIDSYRHSMNVYLHFLQDTQGLTLITVRSCDFCQKNIVSFLAWLREERGNVATTINHRLSDIRGFCHYLMKKKAIPLTDYEEIREIEDTVDDRNIAFTWLSVEDIKAVLKQVDGNRDSVRDRFLLSIMYESGARINEVLSLKRKDLKPTGEGEVDIHFLGKGTEPLPAKAGRFGLLLKQPKVVATSLISLPT